MKDLFCSHAKFHAYFDEKEVFNTYYRKYTLWGFLPNRKAWDLAIISPNCPYKGCFYRQINSIAFYIIWLNFLKSFPE